MEKMNCCHNGKVHLPPLETYPQILENLFVSTDSKATYLKKNIRKYNQTYHSTSTLHPPNENERQYGQLYIVEGDQAVTTRMNSPFNSECRRDVMEDIQEVLQESSPYAQAYKNMHIIEMEEQQHASTSNTDPKQVRLFFKSGPDCRRYNKPRHDEVAAVFIGEDDIVHYACL